jgi:arabinose-5-phosphate isomerase
MEKTMSISTEGLRTADVMLAADRAPVIGERALFKEALEAMQRHRLGIACVVSPQGALLGVLTAGDICRMLLRDQKPFAALFADDALVHATRKPVTVGPTDRLVDAVRLMEDRQIWDLPVVEGERFVGLLHLHPAIKALLGI